MLLEQDEQETQPIPAPLRIQVSGTYHMSYREDGSLFIWDRASSAYLLLEPEHTVFLKTLLTEEKPEEEETVLSSSSPLD